MVAQQFGMLDFVPEGARNDRFQPRRVELIVGLLSSVSCPKRALSNRIRPLIAMKTRNGIAQWLACLGWSLIIPVVVELDKAIRRRRLAQAPAPLPATTAVAPERARSLR